MVGSSWVETKPINIPNEKPPIIAEPWMMITWWTQILNGNRCNLELFKANVLFNSLLSPASRLMFNCGAVSTSQILENHCQNQKNPLFILFTRKRPLAINRVSNTRRDLQIRWCPQTAALDPAARQRRSCYCVMLWSYLVVNECESTGWSKSLAVGQLMSDLPIYVVVLQAMKQPYTPQRSPEYASQPSFAA